MFIKRSESVSWHGNTQLANIVKNHQSSKTNDTPFINNSCVYRTCTGELPWIYAEMLLTGWTAYSTSCPRKH